MQRSLTIALDMMGGDYGPRSSIPAAVEAVHLHPTLTLILCGNEQLLQEQLSQLDALQHPRLKIQHCTQIVTNADEPASALRNKKDASMRIALDLVKQGKAQACVSSGNTGALFAMAHYVLKMLPGIKRPALISSVPTETKKPVYLLDLGANVHCDAHTLYQFGIMGSVVARESQDIEHPRVSLLNIGSEDIKGHEGIKEAAQMMQKNPALNYTGYSEGSDIFSGKSDVIVCEGFVGNVALKTCEGIAKLIMHKMTRALKKHLLYRGLALILMPVIKKIYKKVNPDQYNGASLVGLRGIVVKSHGNASASAFLAAINEAVREVQRQLPEKIQTAFAEHEPMQDAS
ncbi:MULTISPECIES: phosphate acyltransferase PlsX [Pseudoalteromonas]|uniref:Phosphate acyltransferase n=1 Tax=Pseudoalteromonas ruthenica TaxID=151081 RepID=A0A0F4Q0T5_9GAMM|nr:MULTISPECIES: phosphate acyltransferase PlsX [Pseudoalteromonas]KJY99620.1 phosphate acyltransferase [Pseudoalteromonas ruthenica]KJZ00162.1 phosphate acyltransferase [Pseudoalteromonas ruthenica]MCF2861364.1 phosphate acyltransferase PlsX [Pseudoalteromonas sp. CNAT2-18]MCG7542865.1 phosphate acyltransferase PlsX [Pseudoalteromonas sp. MM17-2]MCG7557597.1 phosphate acyltransferase PlsX [Pseudoalteromonas sp. CNAT2-18.1]|tara:strand:+ start:16076 stop:17110 length:1035 start_codon:yes stop_codon:yes gene_type:complete